MNTTNFSTLLLVAASMAAHATAEFSVAAGTTEATTSSTNHVSFVKQWTLTAGTTTNTIDSIDLDLAGRVYIILSASGAVTDVKSQRSAQVVIEDGVLVSSSTTAELQVEASGSSAVYVSAASTAVSVRQLNLDATSTATLQFNVASVSVSEEAQLEAQGSASLSVLGSSFEANQLEVDAQNTGKICLAAQQVTAANYEGQTASQISMPNASSKYTSTGSFACDESTVPAREPACVSSACAASSSSGNTATVAGSGASTTTTTVTSTPATGNNDDASDDTNASAVFAVFQLGAVAVIALATAGLL
ncbi:hypothetical protein JM18_007560 [Phytophthora kernoviae]|uniref:Auto-transporter adhesin head GIN domain-containing protein n=2 Tax=Phytophthora kernoviae TaxID=325452 RepID=A0A8T0LMV1_9STRA|nr:hypothetical protein G195_009399 [Phytophthora kernoviae 00238/432]KAG2511748.1 hypothetical protein JM16_007869 [Phytophthora kernoviae]KAG2518581.1 hypothetical protein JM18_007560 [Phytophthora kernoviae]